LTLRDVAIRTETLNRLAGKRIEQACAATAKKQPQGP
jgi:hypothetical protein